MTADILNQATYDVDSDTSGGTFISYTDPDSHEVIRKWQPNSDDGGASTPETTDDLNNFPCMARAIVDGGIRVAGTTERFGDVYSNADYVVIRFPLHVNINRRDRVTNIKGSDKRLIWKEEERADQAATVFSVNGVSPILDFKGRQTEWFALLERVSTQ